MAACGRHKAARQGAGDRAVAEMQTRDKQSVIKGVPYGLFLSLLVCSRRRGSSVTEFLLFFNAARSTSNMAIAVF